MRIAHEAAPLVLSKQTEHDLVHFAALFKERRSAAQSNDSEAEKRCHQHGASKSRWPIDNN
jgi:hypothetical protein